MSAIEFIRLTDSSHDIHIVAHVIGGANNEYKAAVMGALPSNDSDELMTAEDVVGILRANDPEKIADRRPPSQLQDRMYDWTDKGYLEEVGKNSRGASLFRRSSTGDLSAAFGAIMSHASYEHNVPMEPLIGSALVGASSTTANRNPIATRLPLLGVLSSAKPGLWVPSDRLYAGASLIKGTVRSSQGSMAGLTAAGAVDKIIRRIPGKPGQRAAYRINTETSRDYTAFIDTYLKTVVNMIADPSLASTTDPKDTLKSMIDSRSLGYMIKRAQVSSSKFKPGPTRQRSQDIGI